MEVIKMKRIIKVSVTLILMLCLMFAVLQTASNAGYTDEMKIESEVGVGTTITMCVYLK